MTPEELENMLGGHPSAELGLRSHDVGLPGNGDAFSDEALDRWLVACCLLGRNVDVRQSCTSVRALDAAAAGVILSLSRSPVVVPLLAA